MSFALSTPSPLPGVHKRVEEEPPDFLAFVAAKDDERIDRNGTVRGRHLLRRQTVVYEKEHL